MRSVVITAAIVCSLLVAGQQNAHAEITLEWSELPELHAPSGMPHPLGVAGSFVGISNDVLIVAGGVSISGPPSESSEVWHDDIYVLVRDPDAEGSFRWVKGHKLERPVAFGASVSTDRGVVCIGGTDTDRAFSDVFVLRWDPEKEQVVQESLSSLPEPRAHAGAAGIGNTVYVAGGSTGLGLETTQQDFWSLDLSESDGAWQRLPQWPGPPRAFANVTSQHNGVEDCVYIMSGRRIGESGATEFLTDVYEFAPSRYQAGEYGPATGASKGKLNPWRQRRDAPRSLMAGTGIAVGQSHILVLGGADSSLDTLGSEEPGSPTEAFSYHTITDTWTSAGVPPANLSTATAVRWGTDTVNDPIVLAGSEIRPHGGSPTVRQVKLLKSEGHFGFVDFAAIFIYLGAMIGVGVFFSFRNKTSDDFFRGGQRVPWFVAGLSIFATMLSSITFVAIPAKAYATDWVYFMVNMMAIAITPAIVLLFLPFFRKIDATSAYEYLEKRFNRLARLFASASFVLFQIGRMAIVMYLPALALAAITPMTEQQCILLMGVLSIVYCTMGGLEAVVWTDTIQSFVLLGGALFSFVLIVTQVDGGLGGFMATASEHSKFHLINWDFASTSFATTALWVVVLGGLGQNLVPYSSDMAVVQRYMSVPDMARAKRAIWTNAVAILPASLLFFGVGTALFVFYANFPAKLDPAFKTDAIFPLFIARELPIGIAGLVVAGIFAAAQSTISTSMNSTSTALVTDFVRPLGLVHSERGYLRLGRVLTASMGILGMLLALLFAASDIKSLWDQFMTILGLFGGAMCGLFCLGIFTTRTSGPGAIVGALAGAAGLFFVQQHTDVHLLLYAFVGITICFVCGYLASWVLPRSQKSIEGLTIHTLERSSIR
jgi:SSS family transporter